MAVRGQTFPDLIGPAKSADNRAMIIKASNYAMANCFIIEERIGKALKKPWYVDHRLAKYLTTAPTAKKETRKVTLLPGKKARNVYVYSGYLWGDA
jgi:hypothetical protein